MDSVQRQAIYKWISQEFQITEFKKYYYCFGINYFSLTAKLKEKFGEDSKLYFQTDHVMVKQSSGEFVVFLLTSHGSGRCAEFLHEGLALFFFQSVVRKDVMMLDFCSIKWSFYCMVLHDHYIHLGWAFFETKFLFAFFLILVMFFIYKLVHR